MLFWWERPLLSFFPFKSVTNLLASNILGLKSSFQTVLSALIQPIKSCLGYIHLMLAADMSARCAPCRNENSQVFMQDQWPGSSQLTDGGPVMSSLFHLVISLCSVTLSRDQPLWARVTSWHMAVKKPTPTDGGRKYTRWNMTFQMVNCQPQGEREKWLLLYYSQQHSPHPSSVTATFHRM